MVATPYPAQPPPAVVKHEAARTARTAPDQVYVVQPGDNLWSIAQKFYGSGFRWADIYHANEGQLGDPNVIYAGQKLLIPHLPATAVTAGQQATVSAVSAASVSSQSNPQYYFELAAQETGMPLSVVKAQCYVESSDGTNDGPSVTGAMGPWQFEPYTWAQCSPAPFSEAVNWAVSTQAYITYMKQLLQWSHGNIQMALAAYNAGQGNWQAGLGYAGEILSIAGLA